MPSRPLNATAQHEDLADPSEVAACDSFTDVDSPKDDVKQKYHRVMGQRSTGFDAASPSPHPSISCLR